MYAVIRDRGKQYMVREGERIEIDLLPAQDDASLEFSEVLLVSSDGDVKVGQPTVANAKVTAKVVDATVKGPKIEVVKFRRRKDSKTKTGHRQRYTAVQIDKIELA